jgi:putative lipoprotein
MTTIRGSIQPPPAAPERICQRLPVEVRDVSVADTPSVVVASQQMNKVALRPNGRIAFEVEVPEVESDRALSLRVHASLAGGERVEPGDLLTTASCPIPTRGTPGPVSVALKAV